MIIGCVTIFANDLISGVSLITQMLYAAVFGTRYLDVGHIDSSVTSTKHTQNVHSRRIYR